MNKNKSIRMKTLNSKSEHEELHMKLMRLSTSVCKSQFFYIYLMWHWPAVKVKAICTAHSCKHAHASNALSSLTRAACRTTTMYSLQTQAGAAAGQATPVSRTKVPTFRNRYKWVTTHFTVPWRVEGWVDLAGRLRTEMVYLPAGSHPSQY